MDRLEQRHQYKFESLRKHHHREIAIAAALGYASENNISPPQWVVQEAAKVLPRLISGKHLKGRGRARGLVRRFRQDEIDYTRFDMINMIRRYQIEKQEALAFFRTLNQSDQKVRAKVVSLEEDVDRFGTTFEGAYEFASEELSRTRSFGSPATMKRSYQAVRKNNKKIDKEGMRYYLIDPRLLRQLGIAAPDSERVRSRQ